MDALYNGLSTVIGIIIGVIVTLGADFVREKRQYKNDLITLRYEFENDIQKIEGWIDIAADYKDKINGDRIGDFFGYFNFSSAVFSTSFKLFNQGLLYRIMDYDEIDGLQKCWNFLSLNSEGIINNNITNAKANCANNYIFYNKTEVLRYADFIENQLKESMKTLKKIVGKL